VSFVEKTKTIVRIGGKDYTICGTESAEYIHRVALKVNSKFSELKDSNPDLNNIQLAMLAAINLSDDLTKAQDELEYVKKELDRMRAESAPNTTKFR